MNIHPNWTARKGRARLLAASLGLAAGVPAAAQAAQASDAGAPPREGVVLNHALIEGPDSDGNSRGDRLGHDLSVALSPLALAGGAFLLLDNSHHKGLHEHEASSALEGVAATGLLTVLLKRGVNERRPNGGGGSFPSGHTSLAFSMATALTEYHPRYRLLAYGTATAIGAARVEVDAHYWHDVIAGAALGTFTTKYFQRHHLALSPRGIGFRKTF